MPAVMVTNTIEEDHNEAGVDSCFLDDMPPTRITLGGRKRKSDVTLVRFAPSPRAAGDRGSVNADQADE